MKPLAILLSLSLLLTACGEEGSKAETEVNRVLEKVEEKTKELADSTKEKYKDVRDRLDTALDRRRDRDTLR